MLFNQSQKELLQTIKNNVRSTPVLPVKDKVIGDIIIIEKEAKVEQPKKKQRLSYNKFVNEGRLLMRQNNLLYLKSNQ